MKSLLLSSHNKPLYRGALTVLLTACLFISMSACTPFSAIQAGTSSAVTLEDLTEDPEQDVKETTFFEWADDVLSIQRNTAIFMLRSSIAFVWSVVDALVGRDATFATREATVSEYLPVTWSSSPLPFEQTESGRRYTCEHYDMLKRHQTPACQYATRPEPNPALLPSEMPGSPFAMKK